MSALASAGIVGATLLALVIGLAPELVPAPVRSLVAVDLTPQPSPSPPSNPPPPHRHSDGAKGPSGAPGRKAQATQVVARSAASSPRATSRPTPSNPARPPASGCVTGSRRMAA